MRVALVLPGFSAHPEDWAIPALLNLAMGLARHCELHIFSQRYPSQGLYRFSGLTHHALGRGQNFGLASVKTWLQSSQMIIHQHRQTPFDLIHAFWADEAGFSAAVAGRWLKLPVVVSLGGGELTALPEIGYGAQRFLARRLTVRYALRQASQVTAGSPYQVDLCRAHQVPDHKLKLAPLGVDTERFSPSQALPQPMLIQAASLLPVKNQALALQVFHLARQRLPELQLHLAGAGPDQEGLVKLAEDLNLGHHVTWHKQRSYPEMPALYRQASLYLQTSRHESQGMAVLEAMACGVPVIGAPVGVVRDLACLPPQTDPALLADQVLQVFSDQNRYLAWRRQARQCIENEFSLTRTTANFLEIYKDLLDGKGL